MRITHTAAPRGAGLRRAPIFISISLLLFVSFPAFCSAAVSITEIMYDAEGSDDGHEWVEVYNPGGAIDLSDWKVFEGGSNHGISAYAGGSTLGSGGYAVIADNPQKFLADWPSFSGVVFDTAFSGGLNNTNGETLTLRSDAGVDIDSLTYSPAWGAGGDGNSLQKVGSSFTAATPTPGSSASAGSETSGASDTGSDEDTEEPGTSAVASTSASVSSYPVEPQITVSAGADRTVVSGASTVFKGAVRGLKGESISNARLVWNFGNGDVREGISVLYAFPYPGRYAVVLDASSETFGATDRLTVTVVPAEVAISEVTDDFIEVTNRSSLELDLGLWQLAADGAVFRFPAHTILFPRESVSISNIATGLRPSSPASVTLLYPNGALAAAYGTELITSRKAASEASSGRAGSRPGVAAVREIQPAGDVSSANLAAPISAFSPASMQSLFSFGMLPWILGLLGVIGIGVAAALLTRSDKGRTTGYTIIEEE